MLCGETLHHFADGKHILFLFSATVFGTVCNVIEEAERLELRKTFLVKGEDAKTLCVRVTLHCLHA